MGLNRRQKEAIIGFILGDAYLQKTGEKNARLRLEHSVKQKEYIFWKYELLKEWMQSPPKLVRRFNPVWKREYCYYRCQSHASPHFGKMRQLFYDNDSRKIIPDSVISFLKSPLTLAVWFMDDGYLYHRDKTAYMYLSQYGEKQVNLIKEALSRNFGLAVLVKIKKNKYPCFIFPVAETKKLMKIISPFVIPFMKYKLLSTP